MAEPRNEPIPPRVLKRWKLPSNFGPNPNINGGWGVPPKRAEFPCGAKIGPAGAKGALLGSEGGPHVLGGFPQYPYIPHPIGVRGVESPISRCSSAVITQILYMKAPGQNLGSAKIVIQ